MSDKPLIRIFMLSPVFAPEVGGIETHLTDLYRAMTHDGGFHCMVATFQPIFTLKRNDCPTTEKFGCFEVHRFKWFGLGLYDRLGPINFFLAELYLAPYYAIRAILLFLRHARDIQVIHAHGLMAGAVGRVLSILSRKPLILSAHAIYHFERKTLVNRFMRWIFAGASRVLTTSDHSVEDILHTGIPASRISIYRFWIDEELFHPEEKSSAKARMGWPNRFTVLYSGRFIEVKGIRIILKMIPSLPSDVTVAIVGSGPLLAEIQASIRGVPNVIMVPLQRNEDMRLLYSAADALIVPSRWQEAFARVIPEAMFCGTAVIASRRGGMKELVPPETGILIEPDEEGSLLKAIVELRNDRLRCDQMGKAALAHARAMFSSVNAQVIIDAYREVAAETTQRPTVIR